MQKIVTGIVGAVLASVAAQAQVPKEIHAELVKIGQIVDPACTAKLYRPLMPKADFNTYWPPDATAPASTAPLYPGITILRDQLFGPNEKDVVDVFMAERGGGNRPIFIYVPGGGGNKVEQQVREGNAFYDNIGRWAARNGMVGVTVQRHPGQNWDDGGRDLSMAVDWVKDNAPKFRGDPNRIFIAAHSAGTGPLGVYVGHPARWKNGVQVKGAIYMSGNPVPSLGGGRGQGPGGPGGAALPAPGSTCGTSANMGSNDGMIAGPSGQRAAAGGPGGGAGRGGAGGPGRGGPQLTPEQQAERDNLPGFKATPVKIMLVRAELDPGVMGDMLASDKAVHDELCKLDGEKAKDGEGHCPAMLFAKRHSHMSEVFAFDTPDKSVSDPILAWMKKIK